MLSSTYQHPELGAIELDVLCAFPQSMMCGCTLLGYVDDCSRPPSSSRGCEAGLSPLPGGELGSAKAPAQFSAQL